jgi:hypothetical protein
MTLSDEDEPRLLREVRQIELDRPLKLIQPPASVLYR